LFLKTGSFTCGSGRSRQVYSVVTVHKTASAGAQSVTSAFNSKPRQSKNQKNLHID